MGYTLSFDASIKVKKGAAKLFLRHVARDVDKSNGCELEHKNKNIDPERTEWNETYVSDGNGDFRACEYVDEIMDALNDRLSAVKKPLRKDATVLRPLIVQIDPDWCKTASDDEIEQAADDMLDWCRETFGRDNIIYVSEHLDEDNPHLHVGFCPVTDDGRLAQKDWFRGPGTLKLMHDDFRQHMRDRGYDIMTERKKPGKYARRMSEDEYKDYAELCKRSEELDDRERSVEARERAVSASEAHIAAKRLKVDRDSEALLKKLDEADRLVDDACKMWDDADQALYDAASMPASAFAVWLQASGHDREYTAWIKNRSQSHNDKIDGMRQRIASQRSASDQADRMAASLADDWRDQDRGNSYDRER